MEEPEEELLGRKLIDRLIPRLYQFDIKVYEMAMASELKYMLPYTMFISHLMEGVLPAQQFEPGNHLMKGYYEIWGRMTEAEMEAFYEWGTRGQSVLKIIGVHDRTDVEDIRDGKN